MKSNKVWELLSRVYDNVEAALYALAFVLVIYFVAFILPKFPEMQAQWQRIRAEEIAAENASLCQKLDIKRGTEKYNQCLLDVGAFRMKVEKRMADEIEF
jgi:hypothetical protein